MATYKVIQDIEAEDKLLGPLTLRQFIYAAIVAVTGFIAFRIALVNWLVALPLVPPILFFGMLAAPFGKDQPTEVWLLAKIRFFLKPKRRIWDQSGIKELVTITVPKKIEQARTKDFSQTEVKSRLQALANTIDSRGWAVKNVNVNLFAQPTFALQQDNSDRLIEVSAVPQEVTGIDIQPSDDMLDERNNPTAQKLDQMIATSSKSRIQQAVKKMSGKSKEPPADYWFLSENQAKPQPGYATVRSKVVAPGEPADKPAPHSRATTAEEAALLQKIHKEKERGPAAYGHMRVIDPKGVDNHKGLPSGRAATDPAILDFASNDDLNVETIARQANKRDQEPPSDEVVVPLR